MNDHLNPEQVSLWMLGDRPLEMARHLRECSDCQEEVAAFESSLAAFGKSIRGWTSEGARVGAAPAPSLPVNRVLRPSWQWALVAAAIVPILLIPIFLERPEPQTPERLQQDAQLMERIQAQLSRSVPVTMEPLMDLMQERKDEKE